MIKNLKNSTVFEETVRQVEEQARLKAERYEEGEISDDSSIDENKSSKSSLRSLSLAPTNIPSPLHSLPIITGKKTYKYSILAKY